MTRERMKIVLVAGARPNFMKVAPIIRELRKHEDVFDWRLVHTGQHYDHGMSDVFFEELGIPKPDFHMGAGGGTHAEQTGRIMVAFEQYCTQLKPDLVMVVGDVNSTLACTIVAKKAGILVAHVEAGLRSGDMRMPEEINRMVTDAIADIFFVTEPSGIKNLIREGHPEQNVCHVGHVMIDNLFYQLEQLERAGSAGCKMQNLKEKLGRYGVMTLHRPSNVDDEKILRSVIGGISKISAELPLIFPVHPRAAQNMAKFSISLPQNVYCTEPLPYMEFLNLWKDADVVLTDSGGLQEETTALKVPCITLRNSTERPITVEMGSNILAGTDGDAIYIAFKNISSKSKSGRLIPPLWDGAAAKRIIQRIRCLNED